MINICADDLLTKANYQDTGRYTEVDLDMAADAGTTMPALIEEVRRQITPGPKALCQARGATLAAAHQKAQSSHASMQVTPGMRAR